MQNGKRILWVTLALLIPWIYMLFSSGGWLRRRQIRKLFVTEAFKPSFPGLTAKSEGEQTQPESERADLAPLKAVAERSAGWRERYAYILLSEPEGEAESLRKILELAKQYPNEPALIASWLRFVCLKYIPYAPLQTEDAPPKDAPALRAEFVVRAKEAEMRFPDNAYFRVMRMIALLALKRDAQATALLIDPRAAAYPRYDDYSAADGDVIELLKTETYGREEAIKNFLAHETILDPHFALMRSMARSANTAARRYEATGERDKGLRIRRSLLNFGSLMFHQSQTSMGGMVGPSLFAIGMSLHEPSGAASQTDEERKRKRAEFQESFRLYLIQIGEPRLAAWANDEYTEMLRVNQAIANAMEKSPAGLDALMKEITSGVIDLLLLSNVLRLLILLLLLLALHNDRNAVPSVGAVWVVLAVMTIWNPFGATSSDLLRVALVRLIGAAAPIALVVGTGIAALIKRKSHLTMLTGAGVWAATGLLFVLTLAYSFSPTPGMDDRLTRELQMMKRSETDYYLQFSGKPLKQRQPMPAPSNFE